jgi:hypothetical protein
MKGLSWLFGSMSVAFLCAGLLLLLQPAPAQAAGLKECLPCTCMCSINNKNEKGCPGLGYSSGSPPQCNDSMNCGDCTCFWNGSCICGPS